MLRLFLNSYSINFIKSQQEQSLRKFIVQLFIAYNITTYNRTLKQKQNEMLRKVFVSCSTS